MLGTGQKLLRRKGQAAFLGVALAALPSIASAHVKWFAPYDVPSQPRVLSLVFDRLFWLPLSYALGALLLTCYLERGPVGRAVLQTVEALGRPLREIGRAVGKECRSRWS